MNAKMNLNEIIAKIDALLKAGEDTKAEEALVEAIARYAETEPGNIIGQSVLFNELGSFYRSRGVFGKSEEAFLKAKALLEEMREHVYIVDVPEVAGCCACDALNCGEPRHEGGPRKRQSHREIVYANESMTANYATTLNNLAGLYRMSRQFQKAADTFDMAIQVYEACREDVSPDYFASGYNNKGLVYLDMQDVDKARAMFLRAKEILEQDGAHPFALGTTISNLGFASVMGKKFLEAIELFQKAKALFEEARNPEMVQNCQKMLSQLEAEQ